MWRNVLWDIFRVDRFAPSVGRWEDLIVDLILLPLGQDKTDLYCIHGIRYDKKTANGSRISFPTHSSSGRRPQKDVCITIQKLLKGCWRIIWQQDHVRKFVTLVSKRNLSGRKNAFRDGGSIALYTVYTSTLFTLLHWLHCLYYSNCFTLFILFKLFNTA